MMVVVRWGSLLLCVSASASAYAEPLAFQSSDTGSAPLLARWPVVPKDTSMSIEDQLTI